MTALRCRLIALAAAALTGCAVTEINIDVYKGPLANHEQVQVRQFAAMAVAARPLLIGLRDNVEDRARLLQGRRLLKEDPCPTVNPLICDSGLVSADARRINALIGLYEDEAGEARLQPFIDRIRDALADYRSAENVLAPYTSDAIAARRQAVGRIDAGFQRYERLQSLSCDAPAPGIDEARECLIRAYRELLFPTRRSDGAPAEYASSQLARASWRLQQILGATAQTFHRGGLQLFSGAEFGRADVSANAVFNRLRDRDLVRAHAERLFRNPKGLEVEEFVSLVGAIGDAFHSARESLRRGLWATLDLAIAVSSSELTSYRRSHPSVLPSIGRLVADLVQPEHVAVGMCVTDGRSLIPSSIELAALLPDFRPPAGARDLLMASAWPNVGPSAYLSGFPAMNFRALRETYQGSARAAQNILSNRFEGHPDRLAFTLRRIDLVLADQNMRLACDAAGNGDLQVNFGTNERTRLTYGLARAPTIGARTVANTFSETEKNFETLARSVGGGGLEDGRLPTGLIQNIENYLREIEVAPFPNYDKNGKQRILLERLIDALVVFAEKILFIANNNYVLDPSTQAREQINPYVFGLQSIGNHIMITADELRHRHSHRDKLEARAEVERAALRRALVPPPGKLLDDTIAAMRGDAARLASQVSAQRGLQQEAEAVAGPTPKEADRIQARTNADQAIRDAQSDLSKKKSGAVGILEAYKQLVAPGALRAKLEARLRGSGKAKFSEKDVVTDAAALIDDEIKAAPAGVDTAATTKPLADAKPYFEDQKAKAPTTPELDVVVQIVAVQDRLKAAKATVDDEITVLERKAEDAKAKRAALEKAIAAADKAAGLGAEQRELEAAANALAGDREKLLNDVHAAKPYDSASAAWSALKVHVQARTGADWVAAANYMKKSTPPIAYGAADAGAIVGTPPGSGAAPKENAQDVIDRIIATLRHEYIMAVRQYGENGGTAPMIRDALARAFEQRSGLTYLRPSSAYLRSSYAATLLQDDPGLRWRNLLNGPVRRSIPFIGADLENHESEQRFRILSDIDKQYWQSINRVRLSGGGATNYAIVKDDLGNWYVKGYSSDTTAITKAATNLALFNIGGKLGTDLLNRGRRADAAASGAAGAADVTKADRSAVGRALDRFKRQYETKTETDAKSAVSQLANDGGVSTRIKAALTKNNDTKDMKEFPGEVDTARAEYLDAPGAALGKAETAEARAAGVVTAARALWKFRGGLVERLGTVKLAAGDDAKQKAARESAQRIVMQSVDEAIDTLIAGRETAVRDFEGQILVLGEATKAD